jgi:hypothetical protein
MSGMFGDMSFDDIDTTFPRGVYRIRLDSIKDVEANTEMGEPDRRFKIFNFSISDDTDEIKDFDGEQVKGVFLNYWPNLTETEYKEMSGKDKGNVRRNAKLYKSLASAFGADPEAIDSANVDFNEYEGSFVFAALYMNKDGEPCVQGDSFVHESAVEI